jgi:hypothetical protein
MQIDDTQSARKRYRRASDTFKFACAGLAYAVTVSPFAVGQIAESGGAQ